MLQKYTEMLQNTAFTSVGALSEWLFITDLFQYYFFKNGEEIKPQLRLFLNYHKFYTGSGNYKG